MRTRERVIKIGWEISQLSLNSYESRTLPLSIRRKLLQNQPHLKYKQGQRDSDLSIMVAGPCKNGYLEKSKAQNEISRG